MSSYITVRNRVNLEPQEIIEVQREYNKFCDNVQVYGDPEATLQQSGQNDCYRFKYHTVAGKNIFYCDIDGKRQPYFAYKVSFMQHNGYYIKTGRRRLGISHICGKKSCINIKHMKIEPNSINNERRTCHDWISDLLKKINNNQRIEFTTKGQITVDIINQAYQQYYPDFDVNDLHHCRHTDNPCFINRIKYIG